jgi:hypothetical protein
MTKKHKQEVDEDELFEDLDEKEEHREAWEHKHQKDKDFRKKYEDSDDEDWN